MLTGMVVVPVVSRWSASLPSLEGWYGVTTSFQSYLGLEIVGKNCRIMESPSALGGGFLLSRDLYNAPTRLNHKFSRAVG